MRKYQLLWILIGIALICISITYTAYTFYKFIAYRELNIDASIVPDRQGWNLSKDMIHFGLVQPGGASIRYFNISTDRNAYVTMYVTGELAEWITINPNNFILNATEGQKKINIMLSPPPNATIGNYSGKIKVYFLRP